MNGLDCNGWSAGRLVFSTARQRPWMASHACTPTAIVLADRFRVLFAPRDDAGRSIPTYVDLALDDPTRVLAVGDAPIMDLGALGTFDDGGIMPCSVVRDEVGNLVLYYVGWNASVTVPYRNAIGMAVSADDGMSFTRLFPGAVVDRTRTEPYFTASPCAFRHGADWHLWYASTIGFVTDGRRTDPIYTLRHATSRDGVDWTRDGAPALRQRHAGEAQARPSVREVAAGSFEMWYCHRDDCDFRDGVGSYRIAVARTRDLAGSWTRVDDEAGPPRGEHDRAMQCYPNVVEHAGRLHLFYNGDGFGRAGILHASRPA